MPKAALGLVPLALAALVATAEAPRAQPGPSPCAPTIRVERGDTLSRIAERCGISEAAILRANPRLEGSGDLRVGMELRASSDGAAATADRLRGLADETAGALAGVARELGSAVDDLLERNPDLRQRLQSLGERMAGRETPARRVQVEVAPERVEAGGPATVTARGLAPDAPVVIGGGPPGGAYEIITRTRADAQGTLDAAIRIPDWAGALDRIVIVLAGPDAEWTARSRPLAVIGSRL